MTTAAPIATRPDDPLSRPVSSWTARLAGLRSRVDETDPRVIECRQALAYHRIAKVIDAEQAAQLPKAYANRLAKRVRELAAVS